MINFRADRVIVSANENWLYLDFWPFVAYAYRTLFPGVRITLAFVSERLESDPFLEQLRRHGEVVLLRPVRDIPQAAQCKMARYFVAAQRGDEVCFIDDIDVIPISAEWVASKTEKRAAGTMLFVGSEVYGNTGDGQIPVSMMTAEGRLFRTLFNPNDLSFPAFLDSLKGRRGQHQDIESRVYHEGMACTTDAKTLGQFLFSDEALIRQLRIERPVPVTCVPRGYEQKDTIDRSWWGELDLTKLERGGYLTAHSGRPYLEHRAGNDAIIDYLRRRYHGEAVPAPLEKYPTVDPDMNFQNPKRRATYEWICNNISTENSILELGSNFDLTNYLSRYYELRTITTRLDIVNLYPAYYILAPGQGGHFFDPKLIEQGFSLYNTYRPHGLLLISDRNWRDHRTLEEFTESFFIKLPHKPIVIQTEL